MSFPVFDGFSIKKNGIQECQFVLIEKENLLMYFCFCRNNTNYHLVIESNVVIYSPARDMTAYLECVFVNKSKNSIIIDTTIFKNFTLFTCNHR